ncbi:proprotein convertase P-domain-containing protein, partial [Saprospiraceae bacterium]|nr:proprotein convertase P-domain-containing protein [Saprospiraceae bacterium]
MKDKIQILLSMVVCIMMTFSMNAQTYNFTVTGEAIDGSINSGSTLSGQFCSGGLSAITADVSDAGFICPDGTDLGDVIGEGLNIDNVTIDLSHFFDGDVDIILNAPDGTNLKLTDSDGGSGDDFTGTIFMDGNPVMGTSGAAPYTGSFQPAGGPFASSFAGASASGTWTLEACDSFNDGGIDGDGWNSASITMAPNELGCPIVCTLTCDPDQLINLEAGECEELVLFNPAMLGGDDLCMVAETFDISGFQDGFGPDDATTNASGTGAFVDVSGAPASIFTGGGTTTGTSCYNMVAPVAGGFSVDWNYDTPDGSFWDPVSVTVDGARTELTANNFGAGTESGTFNGNVNAGSTINLCQEHDASVGPSNTTWSNLALTVAPGYVIEQCGGPESGSYQGPGTYVIEYCATNNQDLEDVINCSTTIVINEYQGPVLSALTCNDGVNISVDDACNVEFGADMFLEGGPYSCYDDYTVTIIPFGNPNLALVPTGPVDFSNLLGTHEYSVTSEDGNSCWGTFTVEDKLGPTIACRNLTVSCIEPIPTEPNPGGEVTSNYVIVSNVMPPEDAVTTYTIDIADGGSITDLNVIVDFGYDNTTASGLKVVLTSPQGVDYQLWDYLNGCGGFFSYIGDDAGIADNTCAALQSGLNYDIATFLGGFGFPSTPFSTANGTNPDGTWTLTIDESTGFAGEAGPLTINNVELVITQFFEEVLPSDNCGNVTISSSDVETPGSCETGVDRVIERTYLITDQNGMSSECTQTITVTTIGVNDITAPVTPIDLPCGTGTSPEDIATFFDDPSTNDITNCSVDVIEKNEGIAFGYFNYPSTGCDGNVYTQPVDNNVCSLYSTYSDQELPACEPGCSGNVKVIRTWTIIDWCNPSDAPLTFIQIIKSVDTEAPQVEAEGFSVSVNPWNCQADFSLPAPTLLKDSCTEDVSYTVSGPAGTTLLAPNTSANSSDFWIVFGAPQGVNVFTYTASDCCGNTANAEIEVSVFDATPPVPVATSNVIVNLTTNGTPDENGNASGEAKVFVSSINNGSYDGCSSSVKVEIAREDDACDVSGNDTFNADGHPGDGSPNPNASNYDPDGGSYVSFCCADIDQVDEVTGVEFGLVSVRMRVFDDGNNTGFYGDFVDNNGDGDVLDAGEYDNYNETWVTVRVEGKYVAGIVCPADVTLACDMDYTDPNMIGTATTQSLCGSESVTTSFTPQLNACGVGFVIATYTVEGSSPSISCSQRITVENPYPAFDPSGIRFPRDLPTSPTGQIACTDDITYDPPTWTAGPCDFIGYSESVDTFFIEEGSGDSDACFKILRSFTVIDWCVYDETNGAEGLTLGSQTIKITDKEAPVLLACEDATYDVDADCVRTSTVLTNMAEDNGDCASDWLKWQVFVDTWADGVVDYEYSSFLPSNDSNINNDTNGNGINDRYLAPTSSGEEVAVDVTEVLESSMTNHVVTWKVTDGCGNVASCETTFMVVDQKAPTPYCVSISTALMANGGVELWAIDFDLGAFDNCTAQEDLRFTFSSTAPENDSSYDAALRSSSMEFNTAGVISVDVYVWDELGNSDFCTVTLTVIDNGGSGLRGTTATELGNGVSNADVNVEAALSEYPRNEMTNAAGEYAFEGNPNGV